MRYGMTVEHLGSDATDADLARVIGILTREGWNVYEGQPEWPLTNPTALTEEERAECRRFERATHEALSGQHHT